jgi:aspartate 1-decarboxylase
MLLNIFKSKIHRATVTNADLNYEGSISIDTNLLDKAGILIGEKVDVVNINNGERFSTYTIAAPAGSGEIQINGAAARLAQIGDKVIIIAYAILDEQEAESFKPRVIVVNDNNQI